MFASANLSFKKKNILRVEGEEAFDHKVVSADCGYFFESTIA